MFLAECWWGLLSVYLLVNVRFAVVGGIVAIWLTGIPVSVRAAIRFIVLFGRAIPRLRPIHAVVILAMLESLSLELSPPNRLRNPAPARPAELLFAVEPPILEAGGGGFLKFRERRVFGV